MKLFYKDREVDYQKTHEVVSKAYGVKHPERIHGYAGTFLFTLLDVYLSNRLEQLLESEPGLSAQLMEIIKRFIRGDYGESSKDEIMDNIETRYLGFSNRFMRAIYRSDYGMIIFESFFDMSLLYFDNEDVTVLRNLQEEKSAASWRVDRKGDLD